MTSTSADDAPLLLERVFLGLLLYVGLNVAGAFAGVVNPGQEGAYFREFEVLLPVFSRFRLVFPFTLSGQFLSISAGLVVTMGIGYLDASKPWLRVAAVLALLVGAVVLLGHGARNPLVGVVLMALLWAICRRLPGNRGFVGKYGVVLALVILALPVLFLSTVYGDVLENWLHARGVKFSRSVGDIATLSNRVTIWSVVLERSSESWHSIAVGYGAYGHWASGASEDLLPLFVWGHSRANLTTCHNSLFQVLLDFGILGVVVFVSLLFCILRLIRAGVSVEDGGPWAGSRFEERVTLPLLFLVLSSTTETSLTYLAPVSLTSFLAISLIPAGVRIPKPAEPKQPEPSE
ncbi:MAG: hypothetical protein V2A73_15340 [Pseudomonadota bacterium]